MLLMSAGQPFALLADDAVVLLIFLRTGQPAHLQGLGVQPDQGKRRAQFVRDVGDEVGLQSRQRHFLGDVAIGQRNSAGQHQRERGQGKKTDAREALANRRQRRAAQLDGQGQSRKAPSRFRSTSGIPPSQPLDSTNAVESYLLRNIMTAWFLSVCASFTLRLMTWSSISGKELVAQVFGVEGTCRRLRRSPSSWSFIAKSAVD